MNLQRKWCTRKPLLWVKLRSHQQAVTRRIRKVSPLHGVWDSVWKPLSCCLPVWLMVNLGRVSWKRQWMQQQTVLDARERESPSMALEGCWSLWTYQIISRQKWRTWAQVQTGHDLVVVCCSSPKLWCCVAFTCGLPLGPRRSLWIIYSCTSESSLFLQHQNPRPYLYFRQHFCMDEQCWSNVWPSRSCLWFTPLLPLWELFTSARGKECSLLDSYMHIDLGNVCC